MGGKKVYAYFDGSNFYKLSNLNYGTSKVKYNHISNNLIKNPRERLVRIKYFIAPVNQQECPQLYSSQQKFFNALKSTPLLEVVLGKLVSRPLNKIRVDCPDCGIQQSEELQCPSCTNKIPFNKTYKTEEKGVDVSLALHLLLDALKDKYDIALVFSSDADICPAIRYVIKELNKKVIYCRFPSPKTHELIQCCSETRIITKEVIDNSAL